MAKKKFKPTTTILIVSIIIALVVGGVGGNLINQKSDDSRYCSYTFTRDTKVGIAPFSDREGWSIDLKTPCDTLCGGNKGVPIDADLVYGIYGGSLNRALEINCGCIT